MHDKSGVEGTARFEGVQGFGFNPGVRHKIQVQDSEHEKVQHFQARLFKPDANGLKLNGLSARDCAAPKRRHFEAALLCTTSIFRTTLMLGVSPRSKVLLRAGAVGVGVGIEGHRSRSRIRNGSSWCCCS